MCSPQNKLMINFYLPSKNKRTLTQFWENSYLSSPHRPYYHFNHSKVLYNLKKQSHLSSKLFSWSILPQAHWPSKTSHWTRPTSHLTQTTRPSASPLLRKRKRAPLPRTSWWTFSSTMGWAPKAALTQTAPLWPPSKSGWPLFSNLITKYSRRRWLKGSRFSYPNPKRQNRRVRARRKPS